MLVGTVLVLAECAAADSLFTKAVAERGTLISNKQVKFEVGDIITVIVSETIDATTIADTNTKKESDVTSEAKAEDNQFLIANKPDGLELIPEERLPNWGIEMKKEQKVTGKTRRSNKLTTTVACTVTEVFENGNIAIEGHKIVSVNREDSNLRVSGIVRSRDVTPANTVRSDQIADAVIELRGRGPLWNNQRRGLVTRFLDWFSPF